MLLTKKRISKIFKSLRASKLPYLPYILNIEPGNICNLSCPLCPTGSKDASLKKGLLSFDFFKKVFDQLCDNLKCVNLYSWGEPLLNTELGKIVRYIKEKNKKIRIITSTNLNIRDKLLLDELISCGIDEVIISCDGASEAVYSKYRVGGDFDLVVANMKYLAAKKKETGCETKLIWNFLVFKHNECELEKAKGMAEEIGVDFRIGLMRTTMKDEVLKPHKEVIAGDKEWIPDNPLYSAYDKEKFLPKKLIKTCRKPWSEITINWNGEVFPCCAVYGDKFSLADATKAKIKNIWNSTGYRKARKEIISRHEVPFTVCGICRNNGFMHM